MLARPSRREFLTRSTALMLALGAPPGNALSADAAGENGNFDFIAVNDFHFADARLCPPWFEQVFVAMRRTAPEAEFLPVNGDLSEEGTAMEFGEVRQLLSQFRIPVHVTPGNHDVEEDGDRRLFSDFFPNRTNYLVEHRGWYILSLDSVENCGFENTNIPLATLQWLDDNLKRLVPRKPVIVSTHFPLGYGLVRRPKNADAVLKRLAGLNVRAIFNGHWHGHTQTLFRDAIVTTNRCCSRLRQNHDDSPAKGWYLCKARAGQITRQFVNVPDTLR